MRVFARPFPLQQLSLEARVLYAGFCVFMLFGVWTSAWLAHDDGFGTDPATVVRYYRGDAAAPTTAPAATTMLFQELDPEPTFAVLMEPFSTSTPV